jgi:hypothetical protein
MPYVRYDEDSMPEGMEAADVVERSEYDAIITERDEIMAQRDDAIVRAETAEKGWEESRNKYADAFLTSPARVKSEQERDVRDDGKSPTTSYSQLFADRRDENAY